MASQLERSRRHISKKVRALRLEKGWSQGILAEKLALSQSRLSEIETGDGSFSAEQFLLLLKLFDVTASDFATELRNSKLELQQALARFGAIHLYQPEVLPTEQLAAVGDVVREALIDGSPRIVTAVAPILLLRNELLNLRKLHAQLAEFGFERRLLWVIANTLDAVERRFLGGIETTNLHPYTAPLELLLRGRSDEWLRRRRAPPGDDGGTVPSSRFSTTAATWRVPSPSEVPASSSAQVFAVADSYYSLFDLNGDDRPDLQCATEQRIDHRIDAGSGNRSASLERAPEHGDGLLADGPGVAGAIPAYHPATSFRDITHWATVDIDGDGKVDFVETSDPDVGGDPQPWGAITPTPFWNAYLAIP